MTSFRNTSDKDLQSLRGMIAHRIKEDQKLLAPVVAEIARRKSAAANFPEWFRTGTRNRMLKAGLLTKEDTQAAYISGRLNLGEHPWRGSLWQKEVFGWIAPPYQGEKGYFFRKIVYPAGHVRYDWMWCQDGEPIEHHVVT